MSTPSKPTMSGRLKDSIGGFAISTIVGGLGLVFGLNAAKNSAPSAPPDKTPAPQNRIDTPQPPVIPGFERIKPEDAQALFAAAAKCDMPYDLLVRLGARESNLGANTHNSKSSAAGFMQIMPDTMRYYLVLHGKTVGYPEAADLVRTAPDGKATAAKVNELCNDTLASATMVGAHLRYLANRHPGYDYTDLYLCHVFGDTGGPRFVEARRDATACTQPATDFASAKVVSSNRGLFYQHNGDSRTVGGIYELLKETMTDGKVPAAKPAVTPPQNRETPPPLPAPALTS